MVGLATGGARTSLNAAAVASDYAHDRYGNETSFRRQLFRDLVPFGGTVQSYHDQISGRSARMRALGEDEQLAGIGTQTSIGLASYRYGAGREQSARSIRADVLGGSRATVMGAYDRSTAAGEQDYRQQRLLLPLRQQSARADREAAMATKERLAAEKQLVGIDNESVRLHQRRAALAVQLAGTADNEQKKDIGGRIGQADRLLQANTALRREAVQGVAGARANEATAAGGRRRGPDRGEPGGGRGRPRQGRAGAWDGRHPRRHGPPRAGLPDPQRRGRGRAGAGAVAARPDRRGRGESCPGRFQSHGLARGKDEPGVRPAAGVVPGRRPGRRG